MYLLYKGEVLPEQNLRLPLTNRAFQYNDGFFETIIVQNGRLRFWQDHRERLTAASNALQLQLPQSLLEPQLEVQLLQLVHENNISGYGRVKLKVWREGTGLYTPDTCTAAWMASAAPATIPSPAPLQVGVCQQVRTVYSPFSFFKGPNALLYVMAGLERKNRSLDDLILLNNAGQMAECTSSNLFWIKNSTCYTPSIETGCVNGIMRRNILRWCEAAGIQVAEVTAGIQELYESDTVFMGNVTGIRSICKIDGKIVPTAHQLFALLQEELSIL